MLPLALFLLGSVARPAPLDYYLPDVPRDARIVDPETFLGFEIGEWHLRPDQIVAYAEAVAATSDRVQLVRTGRTFEDRPLVLAVISSPENLARLEEIQASHAAISEPGAWRTPGADDPVVVYLGYSIHGNESSGSNATPLVLYQLASAQDEETERLLANTVVLLDPAMNPDGLGRFAHWANTNRSLHPNPDPRDREHNEDWPGGRTNHYSFDLNRDWLPAQQPESRARLAVFQAWRPNVLADFHEMGPNGTYFFQPGVPSRRNPGTPEENVRLTELIAVYHQRALEEIGSLYYSEEDFDDFYYGKGSTYPDVQGAVGILFEQASSRGHRRETASGEIDFAFTIRNQVRTSFSTLGASSDLRDELLGYQQRFYRDASSESKGRGAWLVGDRFDPQRGELFVDLLLQHGIEVRELLRPIERGGERFEPGSAFLVPKEQRQSRLLHGMMDRYTAFPDSIFYDVSAWTLPLAFGLPVAELDRVPDGAAGSTIETVPAPPVPGLEATTGEVAAYAFSWDRYWSPRVLGRLLSAGVEARVATKPTTVRTMRGEVAFDRGAIFLPVEPQKERSVAELLATLAREDRVEFHALTTGAAVRGVDLGSPSLRVLKAPKVLLATGNGTSASETGEVWHLLDARFGIPVTRLGWRSVPGALHDYSHLILTSGTYEWSEEDLASVRRWVEEGGVLIALRSAVSWAQGREWVALESRAEGPMPPGAVSYASAESIRGARTLNGSIFGAEIDVTHPIAYGYHRPEIAVFRTSRTFLSPSVNPGETVVRLKQDPLLAGYLHPSQRGLVSGSASLVVKKMGRGTLVLFVDDPCFRAFWFGTQRLLLNAIFFGPIIENTP